MKIVCAPAPFGFASPSNDVEMILFGQGNKAQGGVGDAVAKLLARKKLKPSERAWDLLAIALSVVSADLAGHRSKSPDGWTRQFELTVAVLDPDFWRTQAKELEGLLQFLTTDIWTLTFVAGGAPLPAGNKATYPTETSVVLLSGGLDSFIGALDLVANGEKPLAVSQSVRGDDVKQRDLSSHIGGGLSHLQLNHNAKPPKPENPPSQRGRSLIFLAYGVLAGTTLQRYRDDGTVTLYLCENGFITINPPFTAARLGSLSTRTSHPVVLALLQQILDAAGLRVRIESPYRFKTKGEMLTECADQSLLTTNAHITTSCGRFKRFGYKHCGRCVPCLIRRAAFRAWQTTDKTEYIYRNLSRNDKDHAGFDDVRSAAMAVAQVKEEGLQRWLGASLSHRYLKTDTENIRAVVQRGLAELGMFLDVFDVK